jgi:hypothetical protein
MAQCQSGEDENLDNSSKVEMRRELTVFTFCSWFKERYGNGVPEG